MKYFISNHSGMMCSDHTRPASGEFKEVTKQEYMDFLASLPTDEEESTEQAISTLVEKGYTVYKMD